MADTVVVRQPVVHTVQVKNGATVAVLVREPVQVVTVGVQGPEGAQGNDGNAASNIDGGTFN